VFALYQIAFSFFSKALNNHVFVRIFLLSICLFVCLFVLNTIHLFWKFVIDSIDYRFLLSIVLSIFFAFESIHSPCFFNALLLFFLSARDLFFICLLLLFLSLPFFHFHYCFNKHFDHFILKWFVYIMISDDNCRLLQMFYLSAVLLYFVLSPQMYRNHDIEQNPRKMTRKYIAHFRYSGCASTIKKWRRGFGKQGIFLLIFLYFPWGSSSVFCALSLKCNQKMS